MDDLLREFLTETAESLAQIDVELVKLEQTPNDPHLLSSIFRLVHTIKGTCGFLGLPRLEKVAHAAENILGKFREGQLPVTPAAVSLILRSIDTIKGLLAVLEETQAEPAGDDNELINDLNAAAEGNAAPEKEVKETMEVAPPPPPPAPKEEPDFTPVRAEETGKDTAPKQAPPAAAEKTNIAASPADEHGNKESAVANQSIRIGVDVIDKQMVIASELVLSRNQLMHT